MEFFWHVLVGLVVEHWEFIQAPTESLVSVSKLNFLQWSCSDFHQRGVEWIQILLDIFERFSSPIAVPSLGLSHSPSMDVLWDMGPLSGIQANCPTPQPPPPSKKKPKTVKLLEHVSECPLRRYSAVLDASLVFISCGHWTLEFSLGLIEMTLVLVSKLKFLEWFGEICCIFIKQAWIENSSDAFGSFAIPYPCLPSPSPTSACHRLTVVLKFKKVCLDAIKRKNNLITSDTPQG